MPRLKAKPTKEERKDRFTGNRKPVVLHPVPARRFYFAYGSNLNEKHMLARCTSARKVGAFKLPGWKLVFRCVADIEQGDESDLVVGGIWEITPDDEIVLDRYEGVRYGKYGRDGGGSYRKLSFPILTKKDNAVHDVLVYQMNRQEGAMPPGKWYLNTIRRGYEDFGLDETYLDEAVRASWANKEVTEALHARWLRSGRPELAKVPDPVQVQSVIELPFLDVDKGEGLPAGAEPVEVPQAEPATVEQSEDNSEKDLPAPADAGK